MKRRSLPRVAAVVVVLAISMIPLVYAGLLTSAYQNPTTNVGRIHAAVVDEDTATDVTRADGHTERLDLGHQLETSLTRPDGHDVGFTWAAMDAQDAHTAMEKQQIRAILTIPRGFTAAVTKAATTDVSRAATQTLQLSTDDGINYMSGDTRDLHCGPTRGRPHNAGERPLHRLHPRVPWNHPRRNGRRRHRLRAPR